MRALAIAATTMLQPKNGGWDVPSQTGNGSYRVSANADRCTCPDHETRAVRCKHILAVSFTMRRESQQGGTYQVTEEAVKVTYTQQWSAYNRAQCEEGDRFVSLLADLCSGVVQPPYKGTGRPPIPLADAVFSTVYKVYSRFSSRRFTSDLHGAYERGLIAHQPHFNSVNLYMRNPAVTPVLQELITLSALPLRTVETDFAIDSSGFSTSRFVRWFNKKYGREVDNREWIKLHLMCGVRTNVVTSAEVSGWSANDTNFFRPLVAAAAPHFQIAEVSADKAYLSHANVDAVANLGAVPFIPFKANTVAPTGDSAWARMYHVFAFDRETFLRHYHRRSNVETVFSMIKGKFGDSVLSKSDTGQMNEVLAKVLAHNICVVIGAIHELGIDARFGAGSAGAQEGAA
jgi:transposase